MSQPEISDKAFRTRQRIVDTARALFHTRGYSNTGIDEIVRRSKVTKGSLYYHFAGKEALGIAVIDQAVAEQLDVPLDPETDDPVAQFVELFQRAEMRLKDGACKGGCLFGNLALEVSDVSDHLRMKLDEAFARWEQRMEVILEAGKQRGVLVSTLDARAMARFVVATLEGGILLAKVRRDPAVLATCRDMVTRALNQFRATTGGTDNG